MHSTSQKSGSTFEWCRTDPDQIKLKGVPAELNEFFYAADDDARLVINVGQIR